MKNENEKEKKELHQNKPRISTISFTWVSHNILNFNPVSTSKCIDNASLLFVPKFHNCYYLIKFWVIIGNNALSFISQPRFLRVFFREFWIWSQIWIVEPMTYILHRKYSICPNQLFPKINQSFQDK